MQQKPRQNPAERHGGDHDREQQQNRKSPSPSPREAQGDACKRATPQKRRAEHGAENEHSKPAQKPSRPLRFRPHGTASRDNSRDRATSRTPFPPNFRATRLSGRRACEQRSPSGSRRRDRELLRRRSARS